MDQMMSNSKRQDNKGQDEINTLDVIEKTQEKYQSNQKREQKMLKIIIKSKTIFFHCATIGGKFLGIPQIVDTQYDCSSIIALYKLVCVYIYV